MRSLLLIMIFFSGKVFYGQNISAKELLDSTIAFHDSNNQWNTFKGKFEVITERPESSERSSMISIDNPKEQFKLKVKKDKVVYSYGFDGENCVISLNGSPQITDADRKKYKLTCERGNMMKDYYTYLYGLPMKLKDAGTILDEKVETKIFKGKEYLVLKVNYEEGVGDDVWYFYFDPQTYAMEVYQFYHDESKNDGEYILLKGLENVEGILMPKNRAWYYNKDDKYLATDILKR
ncbi:hypothetical protein HME9304_01727 [Flagellimonas maritima]|uniref:Outer membrane lipoprotein-sorting protein n=2 Tax=Flagellimonas maritima TaxID=1383885 RepID=A0A2Z4LT16_9FLAO|nr:hypothetical protein HME9304_01727 [Allomuricauda aurantiaca]